MLIFHFKSRKEPSGVLISAPSIYFRGTYGQNIKLAKKPRTKKNEAFRSSF
jgi:hypothetical protein